MSPSAYLRGHGSGIFFVREYLRHLKVIGVEMINGYDAYLERFHYWCKPQRGVWHSPNPRGCHPERMRWIRT